MKERKQWEQRDSTESFNPKYIYGWLNQKSKRDIVFDLALFHAIHFYLYIHLMNPGD